MKTPAFLFLFLGIAASAQADSIRLHIKGPDDKAVAGAQVRVVEGTGWWFDSQIAALHDLTSDENGDVTFESKLVLPPAEKPDNLDDNPPKIVTLTARVLAPHLAMAILSLKAGDNAVALKEGQSWGGTVLDAAQKPVNNARIVLESVKDKGRMTLFDELLLEARSDGAGKWTLDNLPRTGIVSIAVDDPRFVYQSARLNLEAPEAPPLFVEAGSGVKGRLLTPDGKGAAGVTLYSGRGGMNRIVRTANDGSFLISGLRAGDLYLQPAGFPGEAGFPFVVPTRNVTGLKSGEVRDVGNWKTIPGFLVKGKVLDSQTKKPLKNAYISLWGPGSSQGRSDENGVFAVRTDGASQASISVRGYSSLQRHVNDEPAPGAALDLGTLELKRGVKVSGVIKDKDGNGVPFTGMSLYAQNSDGGREYATSYGDKGEFSFEGLGPGNYTLKSDTKKLVSGASFLVVEGQPTAPINAVVEGEASTPTPRSLKGRALDGTGKPIVGVQIALRTSNPGGSYQDELLITDAEGRFEIESLIEGGTPKVRSAWRPGFILARNATFEIKDGGWRGDLIFQPSGQKISGRVVDAAGKAVPRAWVALVGGSDATPVQADEEGEFSLLDVPLQNVSLTASDGPDVGHYSIEKVDGPVEVALQASPATDKVALADQILPNSRLGYLWGERWGQVWDALGTQRMEAAVLRSKTGGDSWSWVWNGYLKQLAERDPRSFLARGDELLAQGAANNRTNDIEAPSILARLRAASDDPTQRAKAKQWLDQEAKKSRGIEVGSVTAYLRMASVAEVLQEGYGAKWVDFAAQIAAQFSDKVRSDQAREWGGLAAKSGAASLDNLGQEWAPNAQLSAYAGALHTWVEQGNLEAARGALQKMEELLPQAQKAGDKPVLETFVQKPKDIVTQSRGELATLLSKTNPQAALDLLEDGQDYSRAQTLLAIGKNAAKLGQQDVAAKALRQVFEVKYGNVEPRSEAASIALDFDPQLADELFQRVWDTVKSGRGDDDFRWKPSIASYAQARAKRWPGQSRILIEQEWAQRLKAYKPAENNDYDNAAESLKALTLAMAKVDPHRALEMAEQLPEKDNLRAQARGGIAIALLSQS